MPTDEGRPSETVVLMQPQSRPVGVPTPGPFGVAEPVAMPIAPTACPHLSESLGAARDRCKMAIKDKRNEYHKYDYASADGVIQTAKDAMAGTGLALIPQSQEMTVVGGGNLAFYALNRTLLLSHKSGEFVPLSIRGWPVIPEKGRPLDKALAVALTISFAYLLRDLLQMPRGDEADMNSRDDRQHEDVQPPHPEPTLLQVHAKAFEEAETIEDLQAAVTAANKDKDRMSKADTHRLAKLKDARKAALAPTAPAKPPETAEERKAREFIEKQQAKAGSAA